MRASWVLLALTIGAVSPGRAAARVERFAVLIGNDNGRSHETALRYATSDAERLYHVLRELGGFEPFNMVLLRDEDNVAVRASLLSVNERIREAVSRSDTDVLLFVYYSGHADAEALHLGESSFAVRELAQLVRGSAADFRLVVVDACRSGSLTRLKGGKVVEPFALPEARLPGDGLAFLTASSATEDAQESDELKSSFFTHALVTGLLGAADRDGDGAVALDEAYRYAYDATLRSTSRTLAGTQHPTFRYDFRGTGGLVLTQPAAYRAQRARLLFPAEHTFLLMRGGPDGPVAAELPSIAPERSLSVRPGRYFVRARGQNVLYEGSIEAGAGESLPVELSNLKRVAYAQRARKGEGSELSHGAALGFRARSALASEDRPCLGLFGGYRLDFAGAGVRLRLGACWGGFDNGAVKANSTALEADVRVYHRIRWAPFALKLGGGGGLAVLDQRLEAATWEPARSTAVPFMALGTGLEVDMGGGLAIEADLAAEAHFVRVQTEGSKHTSISTTLALRPSVALALTF